MATRVGVGPISLIYLYRKLLTSFFLKPIIRIEKTLPEIALVLCDSVQKYMGGDQWHKLEKESMEMCSFDTSRNWSASTLDRGTVKIGRPRWI